MTGSREPRPISSTASKSNSPTTSPPTSPCTPECQIFVQAETPPTSPAGFESSAGAHYLIDYASYQASFSKRVDFKKLDLVKETDPQHQASVEAALRLWTGIEEFQALSEIHRGEWSVVYRACLTQTSPGSHSQNRVFAVKQFQPQPRYLSVMRSEARILSHLMTHPLATQFLVCFLGLSYQKNALVMDYLDMDLEGAVQRSQGISSICLKAWAFNLIRGLDFIHTQRVIHGDIKPANILLERSGRPVDNPKNHLPLGGNRKDVPDVYWRPVYCDFGSALLEDSIPTESAATFDFMAPELFKTNAKNGDWPTKASDVFALALTLLFAATGIYPYSISGNDIGLKIIYAKVGKPLQCINSNTIACRRLQQSDLVYALDDALQRKPEARLTAANWLLKVTKMGYSCCIP